MITVTYNNVTLENVLTRGFRQEVVYDPSGTDHWFVRYTLRFEGLVTTFPRGPRAYCPLSGSPSLPHGIWGDLRHALMDPRHPLIVSGKFRDDQENVQEKVLFRCIPERLDPADPDRDLGHGPKPISLETLGTIGGKALKIAWEVQCEKLDFPSSSPGEFGLHFEGGRGELQTVLDNRWSMDEEIDGNFYMTRTIRGSLRLSRPVSRSGFDYRWLSVPALEAGFKRQRMRYAVKEDGLTVEYEIVDRQVHTSAPWPATEMRIRRSMGTQLGVTYQGSCHVSLVGPPHIPRKALVIRAVQIMDALTKFISQAGELQEKLSWLPVRIAIMEDIGDVNAVTAELDYQFAPNEDSPQFSEQFFDRYRSLGEDLRLYDQPYPIQGLDPPPNESYDPNLSWMPSPYGYNPWGGERNPAVSAIFQCYLQRPYHPWHAMGWWPAPESAPQEVVRPEIGEPTVDRVEPEALAIEDSESRYSPTHANAVYTYARMKSVYRINRCLASMPLSKKADDGRTASILQVGAGLARRIIVIDAERFGKHPELPPPEDYTDENGVTGRLCDWKVDCLPPAVSPAGNGWIYRLRARYVYLLDRPPPHGPEAAPWPVGRLPYTSGGAASWKPSDSWSDRIGPDPDRTSGR